MPIDVSQLVTTLEPERTVLLFGAGSSIPSNVPGVAELQKLFEAAFGVSASTYALAEQTAIIEINLNDRRPLIEKLRAAIEPHRPTGALLNLPLYNWKSIFTTNYDKLIEISYDRKSRPYAVYSSNFDFGRTRDPSAVQIFKLHGTIDKDIVDGDRSRITLTTNDYDLTEEYREDLFSRFASDITGDHLLIIGHSLADPDIKEVVDRAVKIRQQRGGQGKITLMSYSMDTGLAALFEKRGLEVCFGGLDDFFAALNKRVAAALVVVATSADDPLDVVTSLRPATLDVAHSRDTARANVSAMFNGWPATYADIKAGLTFSRSAGKEAAAAIGEMEAQIAVLLGPSGVGKTTAARQAMLTLSSAGFWCWEHKPDQYLSALHWRQVASELKKSNRRGCLLIDDAHLELYELNDLVDYLGADKNNALALIVCSSKNQWYPRVKAPAFNALAKELSFNRISNGEIDELLNLLEKVPAIGSLVERSFAGFTRMERRERLVHRCDADMFVCLKNIFSSESFDDIVLREYNDLPHHSQDIYRAVAAMESAGVRVHRQFVIRLLGIPAMSIATVLDGLRDIVHEYTVDAREGVYAWRGRHRVIMDIIAEHKYYSDEKKYDLFSKVIDNISPSYDIEIRTIRELCNVETGLATIPDKDNQNILLRKMMSVAPGERVPRHRLIRNLIALGQYDAAATEIRVFQKDFRVDGPTARYSIDLSVARAVHTSGLQDEDRIAILNKACESAAAAASKFRYHKAVLRAYCEAAIQLLRLSGDYSFFDAAIAELRAAEAKLGDRHITHLITRYENIVASGIRVMPEPEPEDEFAD